MYKTEKIKAFTDEAFTKMFEMVGAEYKPELLENEGWFQAHTWTDAEQEEFVTWVIKSLREKLKMPKGRAEKEARWFVFNYGWVVRD